MPESMAKRLKRLEHRVNQVAPGKRQLFYLNVSRDQYQEAMAILRELPEVMTSAPDYEDRLEPFEVQLEHRKAESEAQKPQSQDLPKDVDVDRGEFSDAAVLRKARSGLLDSVDFHGGNSSW